jgi:hypothetical protein
LISFDFKLSILAYFYVVHSSIDYPILLPLSWFPPDFYFHLNEALLPFNIRAEPPSVEALDSDESSGDEEPSDGESLDDVVFVRERKRRVSFVVNIFN